MTTSLKWKSVVWCVNSIRKYFVVLYGRSCSGVFGNSICSRRRGENTSLIYVMQQAAINLSLYAHKFERQRCFKILGCISMIHFSIGNRQFEHRRYFFESSLTPNTFWVNLKDFDLSEGAPVFKLSIANGEMLSLKV